MSMYNTPYGTMSIGVNTRHLTAQVGESGGDIEIDYAIEIDSRPRNQRARDPAAGRPAVGDRPHGGGAKCISDQD